MTQYPDETMLTKAMAMHWAERKPEEHVNYLIRRITPVRQLANIFWGLASTAYLIPSWAFPESKIRYVPHIFTDPELSRIFCSDRSVPN